MVRYITSLFATLLSLTIASSQTVTVSKDVNIRSDLSYDILGKIENNILLFRNKGNDRTIEIFDKNLKFQYDIDLDLDGEDSDIYAIVPQDTCFTVIYGFRDKKEYFLRAKKYDGNANMIDSTTYIDGAKDFLIDNFLYDVSEDKSKTLLFSSRKNDLLYAYVFDNDKMEMLWYKETKLVGYSLKENFKLISVNNKGEVNALFELNNSRYSKDGYHISLLGFDEGEGYYEHSFYFDKKIVVDFDFAYDNKNDRIILGGLVSENSEDDATGYFYFTKPIDELEDEVTLVDYEFDLKFMEELYGKRLSKKVNINNFVMRDIVLRDDGGFLMFTEMYKEYFRRSSFNGATRGTGGFGGGRGWMDIYNDDVIVFAVHPDGTEHWKKILYKNQFSQDDDGVFSSFYVFKTPSRLRIIYNDEIKQNNTVSEYVMDPLGRYERNSLLSTDYQNLKLRFRDAVQISEDEFIVPSEKNFRLSLVKIKY